MVAPLQTISLVAIPTLSVKEIVEVLGCAKIFATEQLPAFPYIIFTVILGLFAKEYKKQQVVNLGFRNILKLGIRVTLLNPSILVKLVILDSLNS